MALRQNANSSVIHSRYNRPLADLLRRVVGSLMKLTMKDRVVQQALRAVSDPMTLAMIILLLVNDHVLRIHWPFWWTGKLGDFAWLAFAPLIVAIPFAFFFPGKTTAQSKAFGLFFIVATGAVFAAIKILPAAHAAFEIVFEALIGWRPSAGMDPTDLVTRPGMLIALSIWNRNRTKRPALKRPPVVRGLLLVALGSFASVATTPAPPCDWEVTERESSQIEAAARGHPFVASLSEDLFIREISGDCWVNGTVDVHVHFGLPPKYFSLDINYSTSINMTYSEDGSIEVVIWGQPEDRGTAADLLTDIRDSIQQIEQDERLVEVHENLRLDGTELMGEVQWNRIRFETARPVDPSSRYVYISMLFIRDSHTSRWELMDYRIPTRFEWKAFPELETAKDLAAIRVREEMDAGCSLDPDDVTWALRRNTTNLWSVQIHVDCGERVEYFHIDVADEAP
ncbi:MAG: hypothetical protein ACE5M4_05045 [Anaerolineales bacterium]